MCGVFGMHFVHPTSEDLELCERVFRNLQIRGRHASGVAYIKDDKIQGYSKPVPVDTLLSEFNLSDAVDEDYNEIVLIAHARYSTSDLEHNQPIFGEKRAIAHNGVITQADPSTWESEYGLIAKNGNDSSLVLAALDQGIHPLKYFPDASMAVLELDTTNCTIKGFRNGQRPLWYADMGTGIIFSSTQDALVRAGIEKSQIEDCINGVIHESRTLGMGTYSRADPGVFAKKRYPDGLGQDLQIDIQIKPTSIKDFKGD